MEIKYCNNKYKKLKRGKLLKRFPCLPVVEKFFLLKQFLSWKSLICFINPKSGNDEFDNVTSRD